MHRDWNRLIARTLALLWAAHWSFFAVASEMAEPVDPAQKAFVCLLAIGLTFGSALLPWLSVRIGGVVLLLEGVALCLLNAMFFHNPPATQVFLLLTLALPPLACGLLLLTRPRHTGPQPG